ncbi:hypothetical protein METBISCDRAFT_21630 [Metschnikowia bicuspidata]|uniref:Uncharacterized protein n=1 Tax=Metschnikowia bicuspidata TaxID=27322 RepID=A0A4P9ZHD1_9ASCO|nr:hypothetical protein METBISCDRAFT_21630 [Metschnikowia bicuspidata]
MSETANLIDIPNLGAPCNLSIPSRSLNRPMMTLNTKDSVGAELVHDVSSAEFFVDSPGSPEGSLFSVDEAATPWREISVCDSIDPIDCSEIDFDLDDLLDIELCQVEDLVDIEMYHDSWGPRKVSYVSIKG